MDFSDMDSSWKGHEYFAQWLIKEFDPKITVEIGTYTGFSTYWLAKNNTGTVYTIDIKDCGAEENLKELDNVVFIVDSSENVVKEWDKKIDLLHIDGNHSFPSIVHDLKHWFKYMNPNGIIIMHDVLSLSHVQPFYAFINFKSANNDGDNIKKRMFAYSHGLGLLTFNNDLVMKIDEKYKNLILTDHNIVSVVNFINYHTKNGSKLE